MAELSQGAGDGPGARLGRTFFQRDHSLLGCLQQDRDPFDLHLGKVTLTVGWRMDSRGHG